MKINSIKKLKVLLCSITVIIFLLPISSLLFNNIKDIPTMTSKVINLESHIPYVDNMYNIYNFIRFKFFKLTSDETIVVGKNNMLFSSETPAGMEFDDYKGNIKFSKDELQEITEKIKKIDESLNRMQVNFKLAILPSKTTIYEDFLPKHIANKKGVSRLQQLTDTLSQGKYESYVDLNNVLKENYSEGLYNKTDGKITHIASYYTYKAIVSSLKIDSSLNIEKLDINTEITSGKTYAEKIGIEQYIKETSSNFSSEILDKYATNKENEFKNDSKTSSKTLIIGDNSIPLLSKFMGHDVSEVIYNNSMELDLKDIKKGNVKNVICEISEENIGLLLSTLQIKEYKEETPQIHVTSVGKPSIIAKKQIASDRLAIIAKADGATRLIIECNNQKKTLTTDGEIFIGEIGIEKNKNNTIKVVAENPKSKGEEIIFNIYGNNVSTQPITINEEGWFFLTENIGQESNKLSEEELKNISNNLDNINKHLISVNPKGKLVLCIAPNKASHYYKYKNTSIDQIVNLLKGSDIIVADNRDTLSAIEDTEKVFYKTDTHWNSMGAFYGYMNLMNSIQAYYPNLKTLSLDDYKTSTKSIGTGDLMYYLGVGNNIKKEKEVVFDPKFNKEHNFQQDPPLTWISDKNKTFIIKNNRSYMPKAVLYRDSFATGMLPFIAENFSRIYVNDEWTYKYNKGLIESEKPDFLIIQMVERNIKDLSK